MLVANCRVRFRSERKVMTRVNEPKYGSEKLEYYYMFIIEGRL